jgi:hypothetical protein
MINSTLAHRTACLCAAALMATTLVTAAPQQRSPLLGTWEADISRSTFQGRAPYRTGRITFAAADAAKVHVECDVVTASGAAFHFEYQGPEDGTDVPVTGNPYYTSASTTWSNNRTAVRTERRAGMVTGTTIMVVARDGKSFTASSRRTTPEDGHLYISVILWKRVAE